MHIVLHAQYRRGRGRRPVAVSPTNHNPRKALQEAEGALGNGMVYINLAKHCKGETVAEAMNRVGLRPITQRELEAFLDKEGMPLPKQDDKMRTLWLNPDREDEDIFRWPFSSRFCFAR